MRNGSAHINSTLLNATLYMVQAVSRLEGHILQEFAAAREWRAAAPMCGRSIPVLEHGTPREVVNEPSGNSNGHRQALGAGSGVAGSGVEMVLGRGCARCLALAELTARARPSSS